jgi:CIC family chloride channel protein
VVSREEPDKLVGLLRRVDLVRAYDLALTRRTAMRHRIHQARLDATSGEDVRVDEILIQPGAKCDGKRVSEIDWPRSCILASLRRGSQVILPHGDTILLSGDVLVAVVKGDAREQIYTICQKAEPEPEPVVIEDDEERDDSGE